MAWRDFKADPGQSTDPTQIPDAVVYLSSLGSGEIVSQVNIVPDGDSIILELGETTSDVSYLLQIQHPLFLFEPIIVQFTSDCTYNHLSITYSGESPIIDASTMDVDLNLMDWGPDPLIGEAAWTAELSVKQDESGIYRYNTSPVTDQTFMVTGFSCSTSIFTINRLGSGKYEGRMMSLYLAGPLCSKME